MLPLRWQFELRVHRRKITAGLLGAGVLIAFTIALFAWPSGSADAALRAELAQEFAGAYPASASVNGNLVEVALVAAPTTTQITSAGPTAVWSYNGTVPGPQLRVDVGDTLRIELQNELPVATTIHWHGVRVPNAMDGVPGVNQETVAPGATFTYEFTPPDAGTFWYHSHTDGSEQLERGLYGALIVEDDESAQYSQDVVWVVDDWLLTADGEVDPDFNTATDVEHNGRWGDLVTVNASTAEVLAVRPGERVRLRLINASNGRVYAPDFGELTAQLIAVDGLYTRDTRPASGFELAPGNRIDVDIVLPDEPGTFEVTDDFTGDVFVLASLVSTGDPVVTRSFAPPSEPGVPVWSEAVEVGVDQEYRLNISRGDGRWQWTMNDRAYPDAETLDIEVGSFTKIRLTNESQLLHPMHLHGQFFKVISRNGETVDEGHFRETVLLLPGDTVDVGLVAVDRGTWAMHCHIQEHAEAGMMTLVEVGP